MKKSGFFTIPFRWIFAIAVVPNCFGAVEDPGAQKKTVEIEVLGPEFEAEEIAIQNNSALRNFFLRRYSLIFRGETMYESPTTLFIDREFGDPMARHYSSGQRIFRDNYIFRQIENFSAELRASTNRLENSRLSMRKACEMLSEHGSNDFVRSRLLKDSLRDVSSSSSVLRKIVDPILPSMPGPDTNSLDYEMDCSDLAIATAALDKQISESIQTLRTFFYSSRHTVSINQLSRGDVCLRLKAVEKVAETLYDSLPEPEE